MGMLPSQGCLEYREWLAPMARMEALGSKEKKGCQEYWEIQEKLGKKEILGILETQEKWVPRAPVAPKASLGLWVPLDLQVNPETMAT